MLKWLRVNVVTQEIQPQYLGIALSLTLPPLGQLFKLKYKPKIVDGRAVPVEEVPHRFTFIMDDA